MKITRPGNGLLCSVLLMIAPAIHGEPLSANQYSDFDYYVLALSWQTGFCQSIHDRNGNEPDECRLQKEVADKTHFLTVHGLWPSLPASIAARGVDARRWMRYGCASRPVPNMPEARASRKCASQETGLSLEMAAKLNDVMPGSGGDSCLERYEYAKHGVCFGFDPDAWFGTMVRMNHEVKNSPLGTLIARNYGKTLDRKEVVVAVTKTWGKDAAKSLSLRCEGNPAYLTEIQFTLNARTINQPLGKSSFAPQPHPGNCNNGFIVDKAGY